MQPAVTPAGFRTSSGALGRKRQRSFYKNFCRPDESAEGPPGFRSVPSLCPWQEESQTSLGWDKPLCLGFAEAPRCGPSQGQVIMTGLAGPARCLSSLVDREGATKQSHPYFRAFAVAEAERRARGGDCRRGAPGLGGRVGTLP